MFPIDVSKPWSVIGQPEAGWGQKEAGVEGGSEQWSCPLFLSVGYRYLCVNLHALYYCSCCCQCCCYYYYYYYEHVHDHVRTLIKDTVVHVRVRWINY